MTAAAASESSRSVAPWADLLHRHRDDWTARLLRGWSVVDLAAEDDPLATLGETPDRTAYIWLDGYLEASAHDRLRASLGEAARRKVPIIVGFATDREGVAPRETELLLGSLDDEARIVTQELAAGSLIGPPSAADPAAARRRSVHLMVCANVEDSALSESSERLSSKAEPLMTGYVAWLEQANRELRAANARLGRDRLGVHDAAAAAVEERRVRLEERVAELEQRFEQERELAQANHDAYVTVQAEKKAMLEAPRYRFVDAIRDLAFRLPGLSLVLRLRSRRVRRRWE